MKKLFTLIFTLTTLLFFAQEPELVRHDYPGKDRYNKGNFRNLAVVGNTMFFVTNDGVIGNELYKTDGTEAGTVLVKDIRPNAGSSNPESLITFNNQLFFSAIDGTSNEIGKSSALWKSDGTEEGTIKIKDRIGISGNKIVIGNTLYFESKSTDSNQNNALWKTDGTEEGTVFIKVTDTKSANFLGNFTAFNDKLVFTGHNNAYGKELWISNGTEAGTVLVKDINPGSTFDGSGISNITKLDNQLFFIANDGTHGAELWKTDGTAAGTVLVKDIRPGATGSELNYLRSFNGALYFSANDGTHGIELWKSDGTAAGTVMLKDIRVGSVNFSSNSYPKDLIVAGNTLYFIADDGLTGNELWKSDGTEAGTVLIEDKNPGRNGGANNNTLVAYGDYIIYKGYSKDYGQEPWISDGTALGTRMLKDINPGKLFEGKLQIARGRITSNNIFYFTEYDGVNGKEPSLWKLDLNTLSIKKEFKTNFTKVNIYPNPTSNILNLKIDNQQIKSIKIFNLLGKEVMHLSSENNLIEKVNISQLSSGMFIIQIKTEQALFTKKIIKK
ncbi:MAG: ELWxxDGT repeat protein [Polaribacter sp.]